MSTKYLRRWRWLTLVLLAYPALGPADSAWAADQKKVLVLHSARHDQALSLVGERELPRILQAGLAHKVDYHAEYVDVARFPDPESQIAFRDFLARKYSGQRFDLVIAVEKGAFLFVATYRDSLFPDTPVIFSTTDENVRRLTNSTGVIVPLDLASMLTLATALQPDVNQVFVVTGVSARDKEYESLARTQFQPFGRRITFTYLSGLPARVLEQRVAALPERSIVCFLTFYADGAGENFRPVDYLDRLAPVANRPIYSWVDATMGHGVVGGNLRELTSLFRAMGDSAVRVLRGERADDIPTALPDVTVPQVDWRQLQRWRISEDRVPAGTRVLFREPGVWERNGVYIIAAATIVLAQTGLIAGLFFQRTRRRRAEKQTAASHAELRTSYKRIRDLGSRLLTAQESERSRVARELHDDISQRAAILVMDLQRLYGPHQEQGPSADRLASEAVHQAQEITTSLQDLSHRLHPTTLRTIGPVAAFEQLRQEMSQPGITVMFSHEQVPATLAHDLALCLFRVAQEALHKVVRHSRARNVSMHLTGGLDEVTLRIVDDGAGFDVDAVPGHGLGLMSMRERLDTLGGTLTIQSRPGAGTHLKATVPFRAVEGTEAV